MMYVAVATLSAKVHSSNRAALERVRRVRPHPLKFGNGCAVLHPTYGQHGCP